MQPHFPKLWRIGLLDFLPILLGSALLGGVVLACSRFWGLVVLSPWLLVLAAALINLLLRLQWAFSYSGRIPGWGLERRLGGEPTRYRVHFEHYGGFDRLALNPAVVIEDRTTGTWLAVWPSSREAVEKCRQLGLEIVRPGRRA